jgi:hypothetical protein
MNAAEGTEIIYIAAPGGFKFRFKFNFEWELISAPQFNSSNFQADFPFQEESHCGPQHFAPSFLSAFSGRLGTCNTIITEELSVGMDLPTDL